MRTEINKNLHGQLSRVLIFHFTSILIPHISQFHCHKNGKSCKSHIHSKLTKIVKKMMKCTFTEMMIKTQKNINCNFFSALK